MKKLILFIFIASFNLLPQERSLRFSPGNYVRFPINPIFQNLSNLTLEFWYKQTGGADETIAGTEYFASGFHVQNDWGKFLGTVGGSIHSVSVGGNWQTPTVIIQQNQWYHVAMIYDSAVNQLRFYLNGQLALYKNDTAGTILHNNDIVINRHTWDGGGMSSRLSGYIDELRISSSVRYISNFEPPTRSFNKDASTLLLCHFNEGSGSTIIDVSGNSINGNVIGTMNWSSETPVILPPLPITTDTTTKWRMQIKAAISNATDIENYAGVADSASEGFDANFDTPEPPFAPGNYISAFFYHPEWAQPVGNRFAKDIKHNTNLADTVKRWFFEVETNVVNDTVVLTFIEDRIPGSLGKFLTDFTTGKRVNLRGASTYKYYNTSTSPRKFMLIIGDSISPQISNLKPNGSEIFRSGTTKNITLQSSDGTGIDSLFIFVSSNAGANYSFVKQVGNIQTTSWQVPNEYLNNNYSIKIIARDSLANTTTMKSEKTFTVVGDSLKKYSYAGWSLFSLPLKPFSAKTSEIFGDDIASNAYYLWGYHQSLGYLAADSLEFFKGYWLGLLTGSNWDVRGIAVEEDSSVSELALGYNIIGNNYVRNLSKSTISFKKDNQLLNFEDAVTNGWIANTLYTYDGSGYVTIDTLIPFGGYWLGVLQDGIKMIQKPILSNIAPSIPLEVTPDNWELPLTVMCGNLYDYTPVIGIKPNSTAWFDPEFDMPRPPRNPGNKYIELYFENSGGNYPAVLGTKYSKDFRDLIAPIWNFKIESSEQETVNLHWNNILLNELGDSLSLKLTDNIANVTLDMKQYSSYSFVNGGPRNFTINAFTTHLEEDLGIREYALHQNFPNPFNPRTWINYEIPHEGIVNLKVFDILGKEIVSLVCEHKQAGKYSVEFDATNFTSGVYFYEIAVNDFKSVKKMIISK